MHQDESSDCWTAGSPIAVRSLPSPSMQSCVAVLLHAVSPKNTKAVSAVFAAATAAGIADELLP